MAGLSRKNRKKARTAKRRAFMGELLKGGTSRQARKAGRRAQRGSKRRSTITQAIGTSASKSFRSGKAKGASVTSRQGRNIHTTVTKASPISKGAAALGRANQQMTAAKKAALKKAQQASARARKGKKQVMRRLGR